ncbi:MAG TPA: trypsin-like peptidase domain-containing protein [Solirubrobacteraceae bacterium]|nr:trypsin-like peptidase domain-containing protein [Solirubrobacteraceae bacterium]
MPRPRRLIFSLQLLLVSGTLLTACGTATRATSTPGAASGSSQAAALERQFVAVVRQVQPQVVQIQSPNSLGSGVVFDTRGDIVTNAHVVTGASKLSVTLADGRRFTARVVGSYTPDDLAVISIGSVRNLRAARFADSAKVEVGDLVLAVGNPLGLQSSVTDGIVSGVGRAVSEGQGIVLPGAIQTSAPINPGNSGGALVDLAGQMIGIPTLAASNPQIGGTAAGIGFAIPSRVVTDIAGQIVRQGHVVNSHRAALGVSLADSPAGDGALVGAVQPGGPAAGGGIAAGDTITAIDGHRVSSADDLAAALAALTPGQRVQVAFRRPAGRALTGTVTLGQLPGS